jgi:hypothetical protein
MKKLSDVFIKFTTGYPERQNYFVSLEDILNDPQDCYQDDKEDGLYEWSNTDRGWAYVPLV